MAVNDASPDPTSTVSSNRPRGAIELTADRFVWSPPVTDLARAARIRIRAISLVLVILVALWAASAVWADGLDAIVFALVVPLMLIAIAAAVDRLSNVGGQLRIETSQEGLTLKRGRVRQFVAYPDITNVSVRSKNPSDRQRPALSGWYVSIERSVGETISAQVPLGLGSAFDRSEAERLEAELRRRCR